MARIEDVDLGAGDMGRQPVAVGFGHEGVIAPVLEPEWDTDLGIVEAPGPGLGEAVVDPAVDN